MMPLSLTCQGMDELRNEKRAHSLLAVDRTSSRLALRAASSSVLGRDCVSLSNPRLEFLVVHFPSIEYVGNPN